MLKHALAGFAASLVQRVKVILPCDHLAVDMMYWLMVCWLLLPRLRFNFLSGVTQDGRHPVFVLGLIYDFLFILLNYRNWSNVVFVVGQVKCFFVSQVSLTCISYFCVFLNICVLILMNSVSTVP